MTALKCNCSMFEACPICVAKKNLPLAYVAGPMRGKPNRNFPAFMAAAKKLRGIGYAVFNPAEQDAAEGDPNKYDMAHFMQRDLVAVCACSFVAVLPDWHTSVGASLEVEVACRLNKTVCWADTLLKLTNDELAKRLRSREASTYHAVPPADPSASIAAPKAMRTFDTGATRGSAEGKYDYEGFLSPAALECFAEFMHSHRKQADGQLRASDNWQKGIPLAEYRKSHLRHTIDHWALCRGRVTAAVEKEFGPQENDPEWERTVTINLLCAMMFNVMGMLHETVAGHR